MKYARIIDGNIQLASKLATPSGTFTAGIDDAPEGWQLVTDEQVIDEATLNGVPLSVTPRQARLALIEAGHLAAVNAAFAGAGEAAKVEWEYATSVIRASEFVAQMQALLGLTDAQVDALFTRAAQL